MPSIQKLVIHIKDLAANAVGTSLSKKITKRIHFQDHGPEISAFWQSCIIYLYFFLADLNSLDATFVERTCFLFLLIKIYGCNFKFNTTCSSSTQQQ